MIIANLICKGYIFHKENIKVTVICYKMNSWNIAKVINYFCNNCLIKYVMIIGIP